MVFMGNISMSIDWRKEALNYYNEINNSHKNINLCILKGSNIYSDRPRQ